jgi:hypothetical protein
MPSKRKVPVECDFCGDEFYRLAKDVNYSRKNGKALYCGVECARLGRMKTIELKPCVGCGAPIRKSYDRCGTCSSGPWMDEYLSSIEAELNNGVSLEAVRKNLLNNKCNIRSLCRAVKRAGLRPRFFHAGGKAVWETVEDFLGDRPKNSLPMAVRELMLGSVEFVQSVTDNVHYQIWLLRMVGKGEFVFPGDLSKARHLIRRVDGCEWIFSLAGVKGIAHLKKMLKEECSKIGCNRKANQTVGLCEEHLAERAAGRRKRTDKVVVRYASSSKTKSRGRAVEFFAPCERVLSLPSVAWELERELLASSSTVSVVGVEREWEIKEQFFDRMPGDEWSPVSVGGNIYGGAKIYGRSSGRVSAYYCDIVDFVKVCSVEFDGVWLDLDANINQQSLKLMETVSWELANNSRIGVAVQKAREIFPGVEMNDQIRVETIARTCMADVIEVFTYMNTVPMLVVLMERTVDSVLHFGE